MMRLLRMGFLLLAALGVSSAAPAKLIEVGFSATPLDFDQTATWDFGGPVTPSLKNSAAWQVELVEGALGAGRTLRMQWAHVRTPPAPEHGEPRNPPREDFTLSLPGTFAQPGNIGKAAAEQVTHGKHFDVVRLNAFRPAAGLGSIEASGVHSSDRLASWSYHAGSPGKIKVKSGSKTIVKEKDVKPVDENDPAQQKLPDKATNYTVVFAGASAALPDRDPVTSTTLAFLGMVDGASGQLDLAAAIELFMGIDNSFLAPMFLDSLGERDLFVGIDLVQWLSFGDPFSVGTFADFTHGTSLEFPGVTIGFSPVTYDASLGAFLTDNPASGRFEIVGSIDGSTIPEPDGALLAATGLFILIRRCGKGRQGRPGPDPAQRRIQSASPARCRH